MAFWAAVQFRSQRERMVTHFLTQAGFVIWLPRIRERCVIRGRRQHVLRPLFPGYLFVVIELQWHAAQTAPGVIRLVKDGDRPAQVPDRIIEELRGREKNGVIAATRAGATPASRRSRARHKRAVPRAPGAVCGDGAPGAGDNPPAPARQPAAGLIADKRRGGDSSTNSRTHHLNPVRLSQSARSST